MAGGHYKLDNLCAVVDLNRLQISGFTEDIMAAANNLDAYKYLEYLFLKLPNSNFASNPSVLDEYLPWADKVQLECRINTTETEINKKKDFIKRNSFTD